MNKNSLTEFRKSIYRGFWLDVVYTNKSGASTHYWIDVKDIEPNGKMTVDGFKLDGSNSYAQLFIYFDGISSCQALSETYHPDHPELIEKIEKGLYPFLEASLQSTNLLEYFEKCFLFDTQPYQTHYSLIDGVDGAKLEDPEFKLSEEQFKQAIDRFQTRKGNGKTASNFQREMCLNVLSINTNRGLYVLAYRSLRLDVQNHSLIPSSHVSINYEFKFKDGEGQDTASISKFLYEEDQALLEDFSANQDAIEVKIAERIANTSSRVDSEPYIIFLERSLNLDLHTQYAPIYSNLHNEEKTDISIPVRVFFGEAPKLNRRHPKPIVLFDEKKINLDQLLVINKAMKNDLTYVQGPPGTGKTNTILSVVLSALFNGQTCLVVSYNNHPVDAIYDALSHIEYSYYGHPIPLPIIRLGNNDLLLKSLATIKSLLEFCKSLTPFEDFLKRSQLETEERTLKLSDLLERYEDRNELLERKQTLEDIVARFSDQYFPFTTKIQVGQLSDVKQKLEEIGDITTDSALGLVDFDVSKIKKFLFYWSAKTIKNLLKPQYKELVGIVYLPEQDEEQKNEKIKAFANYLSQDENFASFIKVFPAVCTTNTSSGRLGSPKPYFDLTIMDEAGQCNSAVALLPIMRGKRLLLVGDPEQLSPVIVLDPKINQELKAMYKIPDSYDYIEKSIYKAFLSVDPISDEILLSYHYRCDPKIIAFNNKKFYNSKLKIRSQSFDPHPLEFVDTKGSRTDYRNTSEAEARCIKRYLFDHPKEEIGVITPFTAQRDYLIEYLKDEGIKKPEDFVGTVHAFQGDEKGTILFSSAITEDTSKRTYGWLQKNHELINVATSRAKNKLVFLGNHQKIEELHQGESDDSFYELEEYVLKNGDSKVSNESDTKSRALGYKPFSSKTEDEFMECLGHALAIVSNKKCVLRPKIGIKDVFEKTDKDLDMFFKGHFDFVVYKKGLLRKREVPCFAFELDGDEHRNDPAVMDRDRRKDEIAKEHGFELIRVENSYSRRYNFIKSILEEYLKDQ